MDWCHLRTNGKVWGPNRPRVKGATVIGETLLGADRGRDLFYSQLGLGKAEVWVT